MTEKHILSPGQIAVGVIKHPDTGLYQIFVSLYGDDVASWAAFRDLQRAADVADQMGQIFRTWKGDFSVLEKLAQDVTNASDAPPQAFSDELIRLICMRIAQMQQMPPITPSA